MIAIDSHYYPPVFKQDNFHCPFCFVYSEQVWNGVMFGPQLGIRKTTGSRCTYCEQVAIWVEEELIYPSQNTAPTPHKDMPDSIIEDYEEAASISNLSPRGSAALLRLSLQKLLGEIGGSGNNINQDIKALVKEGLPIQVQQSLDILRVIGNESVHPGEIDMKDDFETAKKLFEIINFIVEDRIARPKQLQEIYDTLPEGKLEGIRQRDGQ